MHADRSRVPASWASWTNVVLGVWLILAPFLLGYAGFAPALWNDILLGVLVLVTGYLATRSVTPGPSWVNVVLGVWLVIAPFALNYGGFQRAAANDIVVGLIVAVLGIVAALAKSPGVGGRARA